MTPVGLGLGRIGNFINGELYGRPTDVDWCMVFPAGGMVYTLPQLYEAFLEALLLFTVLWWITRRLPRREPCLGHSLMGCRSAESWWSFSQTRRTDRFSRRFDLDGTTAEAFR